MKSCKVSIIIPVYNVCNYLRECVDSILSQSYHNYEIILVDDGSTDGSEKICDDLALNDTRIKVFHKENSGLPAARNFGILHATGDYLMFLDSDDYWCDVRGLEKLLYTALITSADVVRGEYKEVDESGELLYQKDNSSKSEFENKPLSNDIFFEKIVNGSFFVWLLLVKKEVFNDLMFDESQRFLEDVEFDIRLYMRDLVFSYNSSCFYAYRKRTGSIMNTFNLKRLVYNLRIVDSFWVNSIKTTNINLRKQYRAFSIDVYFSLLKSLTDKYFYINKKEILFDLNMFEYHRNLSKEFSKNEIGFRKKFLLLLSPVTVVKILKIESKILALYSYISHYYK